MAKPARRGLPSSFSLDLPEEGPVLIGDFLDEPPPVMPVAKKATKPVIESRNEPMAVESSLRPEVLPYRPEPAQTEDRVPPRLARRQAQAPSVIRYQLNLTPNAKKMLEEVVDYVRTYSPENDARVSEVFQGIIGLLHNAMDELELSELPRRGAWGSVKAKNFPGALSEVFERAILQAAKKRAI